jgi:protein-tyrosine phosphatase
MSHAQKPPFRVLFVCMGNICRSPSAEIVFRHMVGEEGLDGAVEIDSAGTIDYHTGRGPDPRMAAALGARGYEIHGRARQVRPEDFERFDLIVPMDRENEMDLREFFCPRPELEEKIRPFAEFCTRHVIDFVPDPYHGGPEGFERVADIVEDGCEGLLKYARSPQH